MFSWSPWLRSVRRGFPLDERVPPGVARLVGAAAALRRGSLYRVPPGLALRGIGFGGPLGGTTSAGLGT
jgi:hypothetical protein